MAFPSSIKQVLVADVVEGINVRSQAISPTSGLEADEADGSAVQGRTLMTRAEMWRFYSLTHKKPL